MFVRYIVVSFLCLLSCTAYSQEPRHTDNNSLNDIPIWLSGDELIIDEYLVSLSDGAKPFSAFNRYPGIIPIPSPGGEHLLWFDNKSEITISSSDNSIIYTETIPGLKENDKIRTFVAWKNYNQVYVMQFNEHDYSAACGYFDISKGKWSEINNKSCPDSAFAHVSDLLGLTSEVLLLFSAAEGHNALDVFRLLADNVAMQAGKTLLMNSPPPVQARLVDNNPIHVLLMFPCELQLNDYVASCIENSKTALYNWFPERAELQLFKSGVDNNFVLSVDGKKYATFENNTLCVNVVNENDSKCIYSFKTK